MEMVTIQNKIWTEKVLRELTFIGEIEENQITKGYKFQVIRDGPGDDFASMEYKLYDEKLICEAERQALIDALKRIKWNSH